MHWLKEGDLNTNFFHMSASSRQQTKKIVKLVNDENRIVTTQPELCEVALNYFNNLFKANSSIHDPVLSLIAPRITQEDNDRLVLPITKEELREALFQMHPDKAPGLDGFNPAFYQHFWDLCGDDIFAAAKEWLDRGFFPSSLNETNICLIPKCDNPTVMKDLRPISLCNVLYKMVSKVLANRLMYCLEKCVSEEQSAFIEGRSILDNALIVVEIINALKRRTRGRKGDLALKIDISKAYDRVDWGFMREGLTALIKKSVASGDLHGIQICRGAPVVSHLLFADDCFLLCMSTVAECNHLMSLLKTYGDASGQEIKLSKSEVFFSRNLSLLAQEDLSRMMGVRLVLGTGNYLGLPSMIGRKKKEVFAYIKDRIWKRINSWRGRALSRAGKEVMIKSVLQAIPSYIMSIYLLPEGTIKDIERMMNSFWWGGGANNNGIKWLAWDRMTHAKSQGGMGFRDLRNFNLAMIAKQGWNIMTKPYSLVAKIYKAGWRIGNGDSINIMSEPWLRERNDAWIPSPQAQGVYNLHVSDLMIPNMKVWDKNKIESLFPLHIANRIMETPLLSVVEDDKIIWGDSIDGNYSVKSGYKVMMQIKREEASSAQHVNWLSLWKIHAPPKAMHLLWRICRGCLPTRVRLQEKHVPCELSCPLCNHAFEDD
ncbi:hypothetical protein QL285_023013 [Trifolium repens]|nr:hypothetical protein QL285_023013 [Trifolium repens]